MVSYLRMKNKSHGEIKRVSRGPIGPSRGEGAGPLPGYRDSVPAPRRSEKQTGAFRESNGFEKQLAQPQRSPSPLFRRVSRRRMSLFCLLTFPLLIVCCVRFVLSLSRESTIPAHDRHKTCRGLRVINASVDNARRANTRPHERPRWHKTMPPRTPLLLCGCVSGCFVWRLSCRGTLEFPLDTEAFLCKIAARAPLFVA